MQLKTSFMVQGHIYASKGNQNSTGILIRSYFGHLLLFESKFWAETCYIVCLKYLCKLEAWSDDVECEQWCRPSANSDNKNFFLYHSLSPSWAALDQDMGWVKKKNNQALEVTVEMWVALARTSTLTFGLTLETWLLWIQHSLSMHLDYHQRPQ